MAGPYLASMEFVLALAAFLVTLRLMAPVLGLTEGSATSKGFWKVAAAVVGLTAVAAMVFG